MTERKLQDQIVSWLRMNSVYVIKTRPGMGTPVGCPDIIGLFCDRWLAIECKAAEDSAFGAGQKYTLGILSEHNPFVYVVTPESWPEIKAELVKQFFVNE